MIVAQLSTTDLFRTNTWCNIQVPGDDIDCSPYDATVNVDRPKSISIWMYVLDPHIMHVVQYREMISSVNIDGPSRHSYGYMC